MAHVMKNNHFFTTSLKSCNHKPESQLARTLVGAELQKITYHDYLPIILGSVEASRLKVRGTSSNYDPKVDPSILNEFATVAFR